MFYIPTRNLSLDAPQLTQASERGVERIVLLHPSELIFTKMTVAQKKVTTNARFEYLK